VFCHQAHAVAGRPVDCRIPVPKSPVAAAPGRVDVDRRIGRQPGPGLHQERPAARGLCLLSPGSGAATATRPNCRLLRERGGQIAARTYRTTRQLASRTVSDAQLINPICDARFTTDVQGRRPLAAERP